MADLAKIKVGDSLNLSLKVVLVDKSNQNLHLPIKVAFECGEEWLTPEEVEAAEHIPAPKVWPIASWVKHTEEVHCGHWDCCGCESRGVKRHGLVCNQSGGMVAVFWHHSGLETMLADDLEPDEAPE